MSVNFSFQRKIDALLSPKNEAQVTVLNFPNGGCDDKITASINHRMSNLTTLRYRAGPRPIIR